MLADAGSLLIREARLVDGRVTDIVVEAGRITSMSEYRADRDYDGRATRALPKTLIEAAGRLVTESFVNGHLHLDKVYTLPLLGDAALTAYTGAHMSGAVQAIDAASVVKANYDRSWITANAVQALRSGVQYGALHIQAFVDVDSAAGLEGLYGVLAARAQFADVLDVTVVAFPQDGLLRDPGAATLCEEAMRLGADVVGGIPWIEHSAADMAAHVDWACALAASSGTRVAMLVDDTGDASLRTTELLARSMIGHGLVGRGVACHARAVGLYPDDAQRRLAELAREAGLGFVSDPHTGPLSLPVALFASLGVSVALGQDDIEDAYYPYGRNNMLEVAFLASHMLELKTSADQKLLLDLVTGSAARVLGITGHQLSVGNPANLCIHDSERLVDLLRDHAAPRWVISRGHVVAETEQVTRWGSSSEIAE